MLFATSYVKMSLEFLAIKENFYLNEFPSNFVDKCIVQFFNKTFSSKPPV